MDNIASSYPDNGLVILTLGRFEIRNDQKLLNSDGRIQTRPLDLLKLLVVEGGSLRSEEAADKLWPQSDGDQSANTLKVTLNRLRKIVGSGIVLQSKGYLALDPERCWVDKWIADSKIQYLQETLDTGGDDTDDLFNSIIDLYQGDFLHGDAHLDWVFPAQITMRTSLIQLASRYVRLLIDQQQAEKAAAVSMRMLSRFGHEPAFYAHLIRAYEQLGYYNDAQRLFWQCKRIWSDLTPFLNQELIESFEGSSEN